MRNFDNTVSSPDLKSRGSFQHRFCVVQRKIAGVGAIPHVLALCGAAAQPEVQAEAADVIKVLARSSQCAQIIRAHGGVAALEMVAARGTHSKARACALKALQRLSELAEPASAGQAAPVATQSRRSSSAQGGGGSAASAMPSRSRSSNGLYAADSTVHAQRAAALASALAAARSSQEQQRGVVAIKDAVKSDQAMIMCVPQAAASCKCHVRVLCRMLQLG